MYGVWDPRLSKLWGLQETVLPRSLTHYYQILSNHSFAESNADSGLSNSESGMLEFGESFREVRCHSCMNWIHGTCMYCSKCKVLKCRRNA